MQASSRGQPSFLGGKGVILSHPSQDSSRPPKSDHIASHTASAKCRAVGCPPRRSSQRSKPSGIFPGARAGGTHILTARVPTGGRGRGRPSHKLGAYRVWRRGHPPTALDSRWLSMRCAFRALVTHKSTHQSGAVAVGMLSSPAHRTPDQEQVKMPLPPGLSPVDAGRLGLWLLGKRNHHAALKRTVHNRREYKPGLVGLWCGIAAPWRAQEYPGPYRLLAHVCGVSLSTAETWCARPSDLPARRALAMADYIEAFDGPAVAQALREYAAQCVPVGKHPRGAGKSSRVKRTGRDGAGEG